LKALQILFEINIEPLEKFMDSFSESQFPWTRLDHHKCPCCPFSSNRTTHCSAALSIASFLQKFTDHLSFEEVRVIAIDRVNRQTHWEMSLQRALYVLMRIALYNSACPVTERFRQLLYDIRPFVTDNELVKHLTIKFLLMFNGEKGQALHFIQDSFSELHTVYSFLAKRVGAGMKGDAIVNSILIIDVVSMEIEVFFEKIYSKIIQELSEIKEQFFN